MEPFWVVIIGLLCATVGAIGGFYAARKYMIKYFEENPPFDANMIRNMMTQMGQKPSEKKVQSVYQSMRAQSKKAKK